MSRAPYWYYLVVAVLLNMATARATGLSVSRAGGWLTFLAYALVIAVVAAFIALPLSSLTWWLATRKRSQAPDSPRRVG